MAVVVTTIAMDGSYIPYERPPQTVTLWSVIPRGLQSFIVATGTLDAKPINDDQVLALTAILPPNFGYLFADFALQIDQNRAQDWNDNVSLNLQNFYRAPLNTSVALQMTSTTSFPVDGLLTSRRSSSEKRSAFSFPIIGAPGTSGVQIGIGASNGVDTAALAGTVNSYISFWQFDLEQIRKHPINTPFPTNAR